MNTLGETVDDQSELDRSRALLDEKIRIAQGMGVDARSREFSAELLYAAVFEPGYFADPAISAELSDDRYPGRVATLGEPIAGVQASETERVPGVQSLYHAMISNEHYGEAVYPGAFDTLAAWMRQGQVVIWTEGSGREQVQKVLYAGLGAEREEIAAADGRHPHDVLQIATSQNKLEASTVARLAEQARGRQTYLFDDRLSNLIRMEARLSAQGVNVTAVWIQQGKYGQQVPAELAAIPVERLRQIYRAQPSLSAAAEALDLEANAEPLFIVDFDGVIGDNDLRVRLQSNAVRQQLVALGVPPEIAQVRDPADIIRDYRERTL